MLRPWLITVGVLVVLATALPLGSWAWLHLDARSLPGIRVESTRLARTDAPGRALSPRADAWLETEIGLRAAGRVTVRTRHALGARIDVEQLANEILGMGRSGGPITDLRTFLDARSGRIDLDWPVTTDDERLRTVIDELADEIDRPAVDPSVDRFGRLTPGTDGAEVDRGAARAAIASALVDETVVVDVAVVTLAAAPPPDLPPPGRDVVLGSWVTRFARWGDERNRARNVRLAAELLDGAVIPAGGTLSFNDRVGERSTRRGFRVAQEILDGQMVDGVGGGTCQVASTMHAAAFLAGLPIAEHHPHSRPSSYIPLGLDATVVWPGVDLVVENPFPHRLLLRASAEDGRLRVEVLGADPGWRVSWRRHVLARADFDEESVEVPELEPGSERIVEEGIRGATIRRIRELDTPGGAWSEDRLIRYPPTTRIVHRGPAEENADAEAESTPPADPNDRSWVDDWLPSRRP